VTGLAPASVRELALEPGGTVEILVSTADLRVRGVDGNRVIVRSRNGDPLADGLRIEAAPGVVRIRDGDGIRFGPLQFFGRPSADLDIDVPRGAAISLRTLSGSVVATGLAGASRWATASGDLRIATSAGPVQVETMSGDAVVEASGSIALGARTVSGDLRVRAPRLEVIEASSTSGDVRVEAELAGGARHSLSSVSGDVDVVTDSPVRLEAQTITGDVRASGLHAAEGGRGRRTLVVGDGSVALSVRTTSGDVSLRVKAVASPGSPGRPASPASAIEPEPIEPDPIELPAPSPAGEEDTQPWSAPESVVDRREAARLDVLRALERGDLDIDAASRRLEALEEAGPRSFRGWC
jgi:predicted component of type VI protein secretion system